MFESPALVSFAEGPLSKNLILSSRSRYVPVKTQFLRFRVLSVSCFQYVECFQHAKYFDSPRLHHAKPLILQLLHGARSARPGFVTDGRRKIRKKNLKTLSRFRYEDVRLPVLTGSGRTFFRPALDSALFRAHVLKGSPFTLLLTTSRRSVCSTWIPVGRENSYAG